jgi:hypothetical protein
MENNTIIILLLIFFIFILMSKKNDSKFVIYKNIIDHDILDKYLLLSKKYTEEDSKFGNIVQKNIKIRKDIFFRREESKLLD